MSATLMVRELAVQVVRKPIKNLHIGVYPPNGRVRVAAPLHIDDERVRLAVIDKLTWIRKQQKGFQNQERQSQREMVTGESHWIFGRRVLLDVIERRGKHEIAFPNNQRMTLFVNPNTTRDGREAVLHAWYRRELKRLVPPLLAKWEPIIGETVDEWRIKRMKTMWGSCNIEARRIWLNLELAKKPHVCLEYILVHEMVHLLERQHNARFQQLMDQFMPQWRLRRDLLNTAPLAHEDWRY